MFATLLNHQAQIFAPAYTQDMAGGEVQTTPEPARPLLACCFQQDSAPVAEPGGQFRRKSQASCLVFFAADPGVRVNDRLQIQVGSRLVTVVCDGPAFDRSGQSGGVLAAGVLWQVDGQVTR